MKRLLSSIVLTGLILVLGACEAQEDESVNEVFALEEVASGFTQPLLVTHAGDASGRIFVVQQNGVIYAVENGVRAAAPFLDVSGLLGSSSGEQGLLGLAFHPNYTENGRFFIYYTAPGDDSVIAGYQVSADPSVADAESRTELLSFAQPYQNHNGGHIAFGPDGYLYIGTGDGGSGGDPENSGQTLSTYLGKLLRIDVDRIGVDNGEPYAIPDDNPDLGAEALPEIWAYGLRNPWRFSFDRETDELFIGDVGQNKIEEISYQPANSAGGENYGWNIMEGDECFNDAQCDTAGLTMPILSYDHGQGRSVTGGYVYRGETIPELTGSYIYADINGKVWVASREADTWTSELMTETGRTITSFGEDEAGELYLVDYAGAVLKFVAP